MTALKKNKNYAVKDVFSKIINCAVNDGFNPKEVYNCMDNVGALFGISEVLNYKRSIYHLADQEMI